MTFPLVPLAVRSARVVLAATLVAMTPMASADVIAKSGEKIGFLGDTITAAGWGNPAGYVKLVVAGLAANGITVDAAPAGIGGNKSNQLLERLDRDVLSRKPQWMTLSCPLNDVAQGKQGIPLDDVQAETVAFEKRSSREPEKGTFEKNITEIIERAQAAGVNVVLLTSTVITEDRGSDGNRSLVPYNDFLRSLAKDKDLPLADVNALFLERIKAANQPGKNILTLDGIRLNTEGNKLTATAILRAFGLDEAQIQKAQEAWIPLESRAAEMAKKAAEAKARIDAEKALRAGGVSALSR